MNSEQPERQRQDEYGDLIQEKHEVALTHLASIHGKRVFEEISTQLTEEQKERAETRTELVELLKNLDTLSLAEAEALVDLIVDVAATSRVSRIPEWELIQASARSIGSDSLPHDLSTLIKKVPVQRVAQLEDLLAENDRVFLDSRVMTDIRPVFGNDANNHAELDEKAAPVVLHRLRIRYWEDHAERTFSVTLRERDLKDISDWIARSLLKGEQALSHWAGRAE